MATHFVWHWAFLGRLLGLLQSNLLLEEKTTVHYIIGISLALGGREGHGTGSLHTRCLITHASRRALGLDVADDELEGAWMKFPCNKIPTLQILVSIEKTIALHLHLATCHLSHGPGLTTSSHAQKGELG